VTELIKKKVDETIPKAVIQSLNASGFPFQTAIRHEIPRQNRWAVHASEYPWLDGMNRDNFLDIVAIKGRFILCIECKKTGSEIFTFLLPLGGLSTGLVDDFRGELVQYKPEGGLIDNYPAVTQKIQPRSFFSEFCVVGSRKSGKDQGRLLERDASLLVRATDAFSADQRELSKLPDEKLPRVLLPVMVTNAPIYTARYAPTDVSLEKGEFSKVQPEDVEEAYWVRFSKSFTADRGRDMGHRSIFVMNATSFGAFLEKLEIAPN
jgi:hypothetical protein